MKEPSIFKPGDQVRFKGLVADKVILPPKEGVLKLNDRGTTVRGVMSMKDDAQRLMFTPDGRLYCHGQYGVLLEHLGGENHAGE